MAEGVATDQSWGPGHQPIVSPGQVSVFRQDPEYREHSDQWPSRMGGCDQWEQGDSRFQRLRLMHDDTRVVLSFRLRLLAPGSACSDMSRQPGDLTFN